MISAGFSEEGLADAVRHYRNRQGAAGESFIEQFYSLAKGARVCWRRYGADASAPRASIVGFVWSDGMVAAIMSAADTLLSGTTSIAASIRHR